MRENKERMNELKNSHCFQARFRYGFNYFMLELLFHYSFTLTKLQNFFLS